MAKEWVIYSLYYGKIRGGKSIHSPGLDPNLTFEAPYIGFLLQNGEQNVLVDTGINERFIVDGKAWGGLPAEGGTSFVLDAIAKHGLKPEDIDTVMYTHLHNDHAGALSLFPNAKTYVQYKEYLNMCSPIPSQKQRGDYDPHTTQEFDQLKDVYFLYGDGVLPNGIEYYLTPGHTLGSMTIAVPTSEGKFFILGDTPHMPFNLFPKLDKMQLLDGSYVDITPAPDNYGPYIMGTIIYNHWAIFDSYNKLKALAEKFEPKYFLCGHDPGVIVKGVWGK